VAQALRFHLLDSGSLYRLVALKALESNTAVDDAAALAALAQELEVAFSPERTMLDGRDATKAIRGEAVGEAASRVAVHPEARRGRRDPGYDRLDDHRRDRFRARGIPGARGSECKLVGAVDYAAERKRGKRGQSTAIEAVPECVKPASRHGIRQPARPARHRV